MAAKAVFKQCFAARLAGLAQPATFSYATPYSVEHELGSSVLRRRLIGNQTGGGAGTGRGLAIIKTLSEGVTKPISVQTSASPAVSIPSASEVTPNSFTIRTRWASIFAGAARRLIPMLCISVRSNLR